MCKSDLSNLFEEINTPLPNPNHQHCGICRVSFEDYKAHLEAKEHKNHVMLQQSFWNMIDEEIKDTNNVKKWTSVP